MEGATRFAELFPGTRRHGRGGRLLTVAGSHARGATFHIFVLPEGDSSLQTDGVEVYGITSGQPGWTEHYGWLEKGPWIEDFEKVVKEKEIVLEEEKAASRRKKEKRSTEEEERREQVLSSYPRSSDE